MAAGSAYGSDESGNSEVYVRPFPGPGGKWQISTGGWFVPEVVPQQQGVFLSHNG